MSTRPAALHGVTILDLSTVGPATRCARVLSDYGARVIKVGVPPSKMALQTQPAFWSYSANRGMEQTRIDLKAPDGKAAFLALVAKADVVIESYRPGVMKKLGLAFEDLQKTNPQVILCATSGFGQSGPAARQAGHDLNYLASGGYLHTSNRRGDGGPPIPGATVADSAAGGMHAAMAIMAALLRRAQTGEGEFLDVAVADGVLWLTSLYVDQHLATGENPGPGHDVLTGRYACYDTYACADGKWISVGAIEGQFFRNLLALLDLEKWAEDQYRDEAQNEMRADFARVFATRDRDDWCAELPASDTCTAPVYEINELVEDPQFQEREAFVQAEHPTEGSFRQLAPVLAGMDRPDGPIRVPDWSLTNTDALLTEIGFAESKIKDLRERGIIG
ncbi:MAG: CaiB/BaiF CoA-transferase family protein [Candidatus Binatia bacterium]|nr:CaiB/BaiF CoA-transferase family protein [Candidatus Binatia bacterium]MDG2009275.1 CaiB/BaiF CoA-transferase family protein [Candidatus Binatia bacterium]